jgi:YD repeat-containing protein
VDGGTVQRLVRVATVLGLALVSVGGAAVRTDSTDCSLNFHVRNANLDCALAIVGGTLSLDGSPAITVEVRGGQRVAFTYDSLGRVVAADVDGDRTSYAYDDSERLLALAGANGVTRFAYDSLGRLVAAGGAAFAYGDLGLVRAVEPDGSVVDYGYDSAGDLTAATTGSSAARFAYDTHGRLVRAVVDGSTTEYQYRDSFAARQSTAKPWTTATTPTGQSSPRRRCKESRGSRTTAGVG